MENASKALLIAGAILVVILIIAIGMIVYNSAKGTVDEAVSQMSSQEVQMYNNQFTAYAGTRVNGSNVKALMEKVAINNSNNAGVAAKTVNYTDISDISTIVTAKYYKVEVTDTDNDGLMDSIAISEL